LQRDGDAKLRIAVGEIGGAVQWINDPEITALRTSPVGFFFRQDPMIREISL
jgi:hypothetical protein